MARRRRPSMSLAASSVSSVLIGGSFQQQDGRIQLEQLVVVWHQLEPQFVCLASPDRLEVDPALDRQLLSWKELDSSRRTPSDERSRAGRCRAAQAQLGAL